MFVGCVIFVPFIKGKKKLRLALPSLPLSLSLSLSLSSPFLCLYFILGGFFHSRVLRCTHTCRCSTSHVYYGSEPSGDAGSGSSSEELLWSRNPRELAASLRSFGSAIGVPVVRRALGDLLVFR